MTGYNEKHAKKKNIYIYTKLIQLTLHHLNSLPDCRHLASVFSSLTDQEESNQQTDHRSHPPYLCKPQNLVQYSAKLFLDSADLSSLDQKASTSRSELLHNRLTYP